MFHILNMTKKDNIDFSKILFQASRDQTVKRWSFHDMQLIDTIETINSPITHMITSKDDIFIVLSCINSTVQVKSLITGSDVHNLEGHSSEITSLSVSNDSNYCFVGCTNSHIYVYDLRSRTLLQTLTHHNSSVNDICMSANDYFLFTASEVNNYHYIFSLLILFALRIQYILYILKHNSMKLFYNQIL